MTRQQEVKQFYTLLAQLAGKTGYRTLAKCNGRMEWPSQGVYFFFEPGETRTTGDLRLVRVGTHAVSAGSSTTLWNRLSQHQGTIGGAHPGGGNHRGSVFRYHVGTALIGRDSLNYPNWETRKVPHEVRSQEHELENLVSQHICAMPFLWLKVEDKAGPKSMRKYIEKNSIAILSNYQKLPIDPASPGWLGSHCKNNAVRQSGLWNVDHVNESYDPRFLEMLGGLIASM